MQLKAAFRWLAILLLAACLLSPSGLALAHGRVTVGDYELVIGFHNEPAYQGEPNGLDLFVTNTTTGERVNGLEDTLRAEIIFGDARRELAVEAQWGQDGAYTAYVLPTEAGDYTWHIWGEIEGTPVDVSMTSSPQTFSSVEAKAGISFPAVEPSGADLRAQAENAARTAQLALALAVIGILVGAAGLVVGLSSRDQARAARPADPARN